MASDPAEESILDFPSLGLGILRLLGGKNAAVSVSRMVGGRNGCSKSVINIDLVLHLPVDRTKNSLFPDCQTLS